MLDVDRIAPAVGCTHVLDSRQFSREWMEGKLFPLAARLQSTPLEELPCPMKGRRLFSLFYDRSTRTRISFETAMSLLGGTSNGIESFERGGDEERIEDRVQILNDYFYDVIVIRHHEEGATGRAAAVSRAPVINAGDGAGQHPTQALIDVYTIWRHFPSVDHLTVALVGDLSSERAVNSLAYLLGAYRHVRVYLVAPRLLQLRKEVRRYLSDRDVELREATSLKSVAGDVDVVYLTKEQTERFEHARRFDGIVGDFEIDADVLRHLRPNRLVLHPLPRGAELPTTFDHDPRIACFQQAQNGLFVRMALLMLLQSGARNGPALGHGKARYPSQ